MFTPSLFLASAGQKLSPAALSPVLRAALYVYVFLAFCSAVCYLHPRLRRPQSRRIRQAVTSWWAPALVGGLMAYGGLAVTLPICAGLSAGTLREFLRMLPVEERCPKLAALTYAAIPIHYGALLLGGDRLFFGVILLYTFAVLPFLATLIRGPQAAWSLVPRLQLGLMLTVLALSHVARVFMLPAQAAAGCSGRVAFLLICIMIGDAFQYFFGKLLGRHALAPVLSPKKTWEGLAGGVIMAAAVAAAAAPMLIGVSRPAGAAVGAALGIGGLFGDLSISALKRGAGVKDTGAVLPGQGGLLDRCDSLLISAPLYCYGMAALLP